MDLSPEELAAIEAEVMAQFGVKPGGLQKQQKQSDEDEITRLAMLELEKEDKGSKPAGFSKFGVTKTVSTPPPKSTTPAKTTTPTLATKLNPTKPPPKDEDEDEEIARMVAEEMAKEMGVPVEKLLNLKKKDQPQEPESTLGTTPWAKNLKQTTSTSSSSARDTSTSSDDTKANPFGGALRKTATAARDIPKKEEEQKSPFTVLRKIGGAGGEPPPKTEADTGAPFGVLKKNSRSSQRST